MQNVDCENRKLLYAFMERTLLKGIKGYTTL